MELLSKSIQGTELLYRPNTHDYSMLQEIWDAKIYSKDFPFNRKAVVIDIGAHNGYFSIFASKFTQKDSNIYSFEPVEANFDIMCQNIAKNNIKNVYAQKIGVSGEEGNKTLYLNKAHTGGHSVFKDRVDVYEIENVEKIQVPMISFPNIVEKINHQIDYCKIDCEGAEFEILLKTPQIYLKEVIVFMIEFHEFGGHTVEELVNFFNHNGCYDIEYSYSKSKRNIKYGYLHAVKKEE